MLGRFRRLSANRKAVGPGAKKKLEGLKGEALSGGRKGPLPGQKIRKPGGGAASGRVRPPNVDPASMTPQGSPRASKKGGNADPSADNAKSAASGPQRGPFKRLRKGASRLGIGGGKNKGQAAAGGKGGIGGRLAGNAKGAAKKGGKLLAKGAKNLTKEGIKRAAQACAASGVCIVVVAVLALLALAMLVVIIIVGGQEVETDESGSGQGTVQGAGIAEAEARTFSGAIDPFEWAGVDRLLLDDGILVANGGRLQTWALDFWVSGGKLAAEQEIRVLTDTPCADAETLAVELRARSLPSDTDEAVLQPPEGGLFPAWGEGIEDWARNPDGQPPPPPVAVDSAAANTWNGERFVECHSVLASLRVLRALLEHENGLLLARAENAGLITPDGGNWILTIRGAERYGSRSLPQRLFRDPPSTSEVAEGTKLTPHPHTTFADKNTRLVVERYQESLGERGFTVPGLRMLVLWLASQDQWAQLYAEPAEPLEQVPFGVRLCDIGPADNPDYQLDQLGDSKDGRIVVFHDCLPSPPDLSVCRTIPVGTPQQDSTTAEDSTTTEDEPVEANAEAAPEEAIADPESLSCRLQELEGACDTIWDIPTDIGGEITNEMLDEIYASCLASADELRAEIEEQQKKVENEEKRLIAELQNLPPPALGSLLRASGTPRRTAVMVVGAALESDVPVLEDWQDKQAAQHLHKLRYPDCPSDADISQPVEKCGPGVSELTLANFFASENMDAGAWRDRLPSHVAGMTRIWDAEKERWTVVTANGEIRRQPVSCPVLIATIKKGGEQCLTVGNELDPLLAVFGFFDPDSEFALLLAANCPEVVWKESGIEFTDGSPADIKSTEDNRLVALEGRTDTDGDPIYVHACLHRPLSELLAASDLHFISEGKTYSLQITVAWRSRQKQAELRAAHCGGDANIYNSAAICKPPTAIPGRSMHQAGLAIDFAHCSTNGTVCHKWLVDSNQGLLMNLPEEPWHWSTNGS